MPKRARASQMSNLREIIRKRWPERVRFPSRASWNWRCIVPILDTMSESKRLRGKKETFIPASAWGRCSGNCWPFSSPNGSKRCPSRRQIVEAGAHDGRLALDILRWLRKHRPELLRRLWNTGFSSLQRAAGKARKKHSANLPAVRWFESWNDVPPTGVNGVIFANELLDAMPVHRLGWDAKDRKWFEWGVNCEGEEFAWTQMLGGQWNWPPKNLPMNCWPCFAGWIHHRSLPGGGGLVAAGGACVESGETGHH